MLRIVQLILQPGFDAFLVFDMGEESVELASQVAEQSAYVERYAPTLVALLFNRTLQLLDRVMVVGCWSHKSAIVCL